MPLGNLRLLLLLPAVVGALALLSAGTASAAHISSLWQNGTADWSDPTEWSSDPDVPNDGGGNTYDATLNGGTATLDIHVSIQAFTQSGGNLDGPSDLIINQLFTWSGSGDQRGTGTTFANAGVEIISNTSRDLDARSLEVAGTSSHRAATLFFKNDAVLTNTGTWIADSDSGAGGSGSTLGLTKSGTGSQTFDNQGTFRQAGSQRTNVSTAFDNTGTVEVQDGELSLSGGGTSTAGTWSVTGDGALLFNGAMTLDAASAISGDGEVVFDAGTVDHAGSYAMTGTTRTQGGRGVLANGGSTGALILTDGALEVAGGAFTVTGPLTWNADDLAGAGSSTVQGDAELITNTAKYLDDHDLTLEGTTTHRAGTLFFRGGATLHNTGTWVSDSDSGAGGSGSTLGISRTGTAPGTKTFDNQGTFRQQGDHRTNASVVFDNTGTVEVQDGELSLNEGGTSTDGDWIASGDGRLLFNASYALDADSSISGDGEVVFDAGTVTHAGSYAVTGTTTTLGGTGILANGGSTGALVLTDGALEVAGGTLDVTGPLTWNADDLAGAGTTTVHGDAELISNTAKYLVDHTLSVAGTTTHRAGTFFFEDDATLVNTGTWVSDSDAGAGGSGSTLQLANTGSGSRSIDNQGTFRQQGTQRTNVSPAFTSSGSVEVQAGILDFNGGFVQTGGSTLLFAGELEAGTLDVQGGLLGGTGLVDADILLSGTLAAGHSAGQLDVDGALSFQSAALFDVEIGGTAQGSGYDFVDVTGNVTLAGLLQITLIDGFLASITATDTFTVLAAGGSLGGAFGNVASGDRLTTTGGHSFQVDYGAASPFGATTVVLSDFAPIPEPTTAALVGAGLMLMGLYGRGGRATQG